MRDNTISQTDNRELHQSKISSSNFQRSKLFRLSTSKLENNQANCHQLTTNLN